MTLAGQRFLRRARKGLQLISDGARDVAAIGRSEQGRIKVGIFSSLASGFLSDLFQAYDQNHADVRIDFSDGDPAEHVAAVRQIQLDVAFVTGTREWAGCEREYLLRMHGFQVTLCDGAAALRAAVKEGRPDLVILDLNMPEEDGLSVVRDLKRNNPVPVIMLTATASPVDRIVGLELGADDYIAKPCELRELLARVRSVLRRVAPPAPAPGEGRPRETVRFGTKVLDLAAHVLRDETGGEHALTASEFSLLKAFAENPRRVLSRDKLLDLAGARDPDAFDRAIDAKAAWLVSPSKASRLNDTPLLKVRCSDTKGKKSEAGP